MQAYREDMSCRAKNQRRLRDSRKSKPCSALLCPALLYNFAASGPLVYYPLSHGYRLLLFKGFGDVYLQSQIHNDFAMFVEFFCLFELKTIAIIDCFRDLLRFAFVSFGEARSCNSLRIIAFEIVSLRHFCSLGSPGFLGLLRDSWGLNIRESGNPLKINAFPIIPVCTFAPGFSWVLRLLGVSWGLDFPEYKILFEPMF